MASSSRYEKHPVNTALAIATGPEGSTGVAEKSMFLFPAHFLRKARTALLLSGFLVSIFLTGLILPLASSPVAAAESKSQTQAAKVGKSGLPLPRYVSLAKPKVNLRKGPGLRYPIEWVYRRDDMPVEIIAEFDTWRQVRDWEGTVGWVHRNMLRGKRTIMIKDGTKTLRADPEESAQALLQAEAGVIGRLMECADAWCRVEIAGQRGWLRSGDFFGVYPREDLR